MTVTAAATAPTSRSRLGGLPVLDGLRAVAAGMVLLTHTGFDSGEITHGVHGAVLARFDIGVAIFFALSGFLLYRPFAEAQLSGRSTPSVRRYLVRRALRILPAYWLAMAAALLATSHVGLRQTFAHTALSQIYFGGLLVNFSQTWSLSTEVAFYLVLPLAALALGSRTRPGDASRFLRTQLSVLAAATLASWVFIGVVSASADPAVHRMNMWLPAHLDWFAVGMALAAVWTVASAGERHRIADWLHTVAAYPGTCLLGAVVVFWLAATPLAGPRTLTPAPAWEAVVKEVLYAAFAALLLIAAAFGDQRRGPVARVLASPSARYLGRISYSVFLWHVLVLQGVFAVTGWQQFTGHFVGLTLLAVAGTLIVSAVSWAAFERPLMELGTPRSRARTSRRAGASEVAATVNAPAHSS